MGSSFPSTLQFYTCESHYIQILLIWILFSSLAHCSNLKVSLSLYQLESAGLDMKLPKRQRTSSTKLFVVVFFFLSIYKDVFFFCLPRCVLFVFWWTLGQVKSTCCSLKAFIWRPFVIWFLKNGSLKSSNQNKAQNVSPSKCLLLFLFCQTCHILLKSCLQKVVRYIFFFFKPSLSSWLELWRLERCSCLNALQLMAPSPFLPLHPTGTRRGSNRSSDSDSTQHVKCVHSVSKSTVTRRAETAGLETSALWLQLWAGIKRLYSNWASTY